MASNVFGTPVTNETLERLPEYHGKKPSQIDKAKVALEMKNAQGKDVNARKFVELLQQRYGTKTLIMCLIYNATGNPLFFSNLHHWHGCVGESPAQARLENGQWDAFVDGNWGGEDMARAAVVYSGKNPLCGYRDWLLCWSTSSSGPTNQVYTDVGEPGRFYDWNDIDKKLKERSYFHETKKEGAYMFGSIGNSTASVDLVEGIFTLSDVWFPRD